MRRIGTIMALGLALGFQAGTAFSDTLLVESVQSSAGVTRPDRGMTMDSVVQHFGNPTSRSGPVGDPPISTWDYGDFVVYFEHHIVIHAVVAHK